MHDLWCFQGARACFARDIPFSAIYFALYAHLKKYSADENGYNNPLSLLCSATTAGMRRSLEKYTWA